MCFFIVVFVFFFKQKTAYEMRISDWSSDVCSSDLLATALAEAALEPHRSWADEVLWAVDRLEQYRRLVTVVPARTTTSATNDSWHHDFHALVATLLIDGFRRAGVPESSLVPKAAIGVFVVVGLRMPPPVPARPSGRAGK